MLVMAFAVSLGLLVGTVNFMFELFDDMDTDVVISSVLSLQFEGEASKHYYEQLIEMIWNEDGNAE
jgi:hypothetical protein